MQRDKLKVPDIMLGLNPEPEAGKAVSPGRISMTPLFRLTKLLSVPGSILCAFSHTRTLHSRD